MFLLPTFNATLRPCFVNMAEFTAHEKGHFCGSCQRVVQDFSQSTTPLANLAAARAASPDGRVCGMFRAGQVQTPRTLTRRLRWFLLALVLVVGQGLTAREALAQVRKPVAEATRPKHARVAATAKHGVAKFSDPKPDMVYGVVVEAMPSFQGGGNCEVVQYIQQHITWPQKGGKMVDAEGRVFASFTVGTDGRIYDAKIVKGIHSLLDAEVLRVVRTLPNFKPGRQNNRPVAVSMTVPVTFRLQ